MIHRDSIKDILETAPHVRVLCIRGPRQAGKTTVAELCFPTYRHVGCDRVAQKKAINEDPSAFLRNILATYPGIVLDEFQQVPDILSEIRAYVDETGERGRIILTGSQNYLMMASVTQSLAGRVILIDMLPLSINELQQANVLPNNVYDLMIRGGYPELYQDQKLSTTRFYKGYINTYMERDLQTLTNVPDLAKFHRFLQFCAGRIGQLLNVSTLAADAGVTVALANQWLSLLVTSYLIYLVSPHVTNFNKQLVKQPKLYFYDTGIACELLNIGTASKLAKHTMRGALFENFVITESFKWCHTHGKNPALYFWRDEQGHEIDLVVDLGGPLVPIEIKSADVVRQNMTDVLSFWHELTGHPLEQSYVIYTGEDEKHTVGPQFLSWKSIPVLFATLYAPDADNETQPMQASIVKKKKKPVAKTVPHKKAK